MIKKMSQEIYNEFNDLFGLYRSDALQIAYDNQIQEFGNGCCMFDYVENKAYGITYTQGTVENPENHLITLYTVSQNSEIEEDDFDSILENLEPFDFETIAYDIISAVEYHDGDLSQLKTVKEMLKFLKNC